MVGGAQILKSGVESNQHWRGVYNTLLPPTWICAPAKPSLWSLGSRRGVGDVAKAWAEAWKEGNHQLALTWGQRDLGLIYGHIWLVHIAQLSLGCLLPMDIGSNLARYRVVGWGLGVLSVF